MDKPARPTRKAVLPSGLYSLMLGMIHALSFAPQPLPLWTLPFVQVFVLAAWFLTLSRSNRLRRAIVSAFLFGLGNFTVGLYWLFISMHHYGGLAWPLAAMGVVALAAFLALYMVLAVVAIWAPGVLPRSDYFSRWPHQLLMAATWASAWALTEWLRGTLWTGFPWLNIGYAHVEGVLAPWAPILGVYGLSWLAAFAAASVALFVEHKDSKQAAGAATCIGATILIGLAGIVLSHQYWTQPYGEPIIIRLVQGNVPQSEKFDPQRMSQGIATYQKLAGLDAKSEDGKPDIIVLPETVMPVFQDLIARQTWQQWLDIAARHDAIILMGAPLRDQLEQRYTNSAIAFTSQTPVDNLLLGQTPHRYDKHHLVPFGEFVPRGFRWFVDAMHIPLGDFDRGNLSQPAFSLLGQQVAPDICYEDIFGEEIIRQVRPNPTQDPGATILINLSNLAWFGDTWALRQHLQIARLRALETGRPVLRSTNTGATAAIDPNGVLRALLPTAEAGVLDIEVQGMQGMTPYVRWGSAPVLGWSLLWWLAGSLVWTRIRRRLPNS